MADEPYTGPPIGPPADHVHEEAPPEEVINAIEETEDDIDELAEQLAVHQIISEERHDEILGSVEECRNQLEALSRTGTAESPLLTQILNQLTEIRAELAVLKSSMDSRQSPPPQSESPEPETPPAAENEEVVLPEQEMPPPKPPRKNRFV